MIYFADVLIFFAFLLVITDFFAMGHGVFTAAGAVFFIIGTVLLFSFMNVVPVFFIRIVFPTYAALTIFVLIFAFLGYKAYKTKAKIGAATLVRQEGEATTDINKDKEGKVMINGELWTAYSDKEIIKDSKVIVISVDNRLRLKVEPV